MTIERRHELEREVARGVRAMLTLAGENPDREGLSETPARVLKAWYEQTAGRGQDVSALFKTFQDGTCTGMVMVPSVSFSSLCEHHLMPFMGVAHVAYIPDGRIVGLSKLARLVKALARRPQVQERLTVQVVTAITEHLKPKGAACVVRANHTCMSCRGVEEPRAEMVTSELQGCFLHEPECRAEFMSLVPR